MIFKGFLAIQVCTFFNICLSTTLPFRLLSISSNGHNFLLLSSNGVGERCGKRCWWGSVVDCTGRKAKLASTVSFFIEEREKVGYSEMSSCCPHPEKHKQHEWQRVLPSLGRLHPLHVWYVPVVPQPSPKHSHTYVCVSVCTAQGRHTMWKMSSQSIHIWCRVQEQKTAL